MAVTLYGATLFTPRERLEQGAVVISDEGLISYAGPLAGMPRVDGRSLDLRGLIVAPGLVDVHVHGGHGITFGESGDAAGELRAYSEWIVHTGVTGFIASLAAPDPGELMRRIGAYVQVLEEGLPGAEGLGLHLEGPFINKEKKGAFNPDWLRAPSLDESERVLEAGRGWIRQMTLAPELPGAEETAGLFREAGAVVSLGHTNADYATASAALRGRFTHVTHTFNAQRGFHHREPGVFGAIMTSDHASAELIADNVHAHPAAMQMLVRCLGTERVVLITDAMAGTGLEDGQYRLVGLEVTVQGGRARLPDGTIAGSTATMDLCVRNAQRLVGVPLLDAVRMGSLNPAWAMGLTSRLGSLAPGKDASLVVIDEDVTVHLTMVKGNIVYNNL